MPTPLSQVENDLDPLWNDFRSGFQATVPDGEEELARVLAEAVGSASAELPSGFHFRPSCLLLPPSFFLNVR